MDTEIKVSSAKNPEVSKYPFFFLSRIGQDIVSQALHAVGDFEFLISALSVHFTSLVPSLDMKWHVSPQHWINHYFAIWWTLFRLDITFANDVW